MTKVVVVKPFLAWASRIDPHVVGDPDFGSLTISPCGAKVRDSEWEFPAEWLVRGSRSARTIQFGAIDEAFGPESTASLMARQYAVLSLAEDNKIGSIATLVNRTMLANRLIKSCADVLKGRAPLTSMSAAQCAEACALLYRSWDANNSDRTLLKKIIEEITAFRGDGKLADGFSDVDWNTHLSEMTPSTLSKNLDALRNRARDSRTVTRNVSTESLDPNWVKAFSPIAETYIDVLAPSIVRHLDRLADFRDDISIEKAHCAKKVIGRNIASAYREFARKEICDGSWKGANGEPLNELPFETVNDFAFPPQCVKDLFALVAALQMACFQVLAITSAARLSEIHEVAPDGICQSSLAMGLPTIRGQVFKGSGAIGFRPHRWVVSHMAIRALLVQDRLFNRFRTGDHLWCQTAPGSMGAPMRTAECIHLQTFAERHCLGDTQISTRRFRKTWAEFAMISRLPIEDFRRQLGHAVTEHGINDLNISYLLPSRDSSFRYQAASPRGLRPPADFLQILRETMTS